jgi:UTP:GlnB (protein PII) uridylyltransferase
VRFEQGDIARIGAVLTALVSGEATVKSLLRKDRLPPPAPPGSPTRVIFDGASVDVPDILTVETVDRPGLLLVITQALFRTGVQIIASEVATRDGRVADRFTIVEPDHTRLGRVRRQTVQKEVLSAIEGFVGAASKKRSTRPPKHNR